jgi:hypothetical protein
MRQEKASRRIWGEGDGGEALFQDSSCGHGWTRCEVWTAYPIDVAIALDQLSPAAGTTVWVAGSLLKKKREAGFHTG